MPDIFISYSSKDKNLADRLVADLRNCGLSIWYDEDNLLVGHDIVDSVYDGIRNSRFLAILITRNAIKSHWVRQEMNYARVREIEGRKVTILPLLFESCRLPDPIKTKKYADFRYSYDKGFQNLLAVFEKRTFPEHLGERKIELEDLVRKRSDVIYKLISQILSTEKESETQYKLTEDFSDKNIERLKEQVAECLNLYDHLISIETSRSLVREYCQKGYHFAGILLDYERQTQYIEYLVDTDEVPVDAWIMKGIANVNAGYSRRCVDSFRNGLRTLLKIEPNPDYTSILRFVYRVTQHVRLEFADPFLIRDLITYKDKSKLVSCLEKTLPCLTEALERERIFDTLDKDSNASYGDMLVNIGLTKYGVKFLEKAREMGSDHVSIQEIDRLKEQIADFERHAKDQLTLTLQVNQMPNFMAQFETTGFFNAGDLLEEYAPEFYKEVVDRHDLFQRPVKKV